MPELIYEKETQTLRQMPENYMLASFEKGYWIVDPDGAIGEDLHIALVKFFRVFENKFKYTSWIDFNLWMWHSDNQENNLRDVLSQLLDRLDTHGSIDPIREEGPIQDARDVLNRVG